MPAKAFVHALETLRARERALEQQIHKLERRGVHMTPPEQQRAVQLKKLRLATKDRLTKLVLARAS